MRLDTWMALGTAALRACGTTVEPAPEPTPTLTRAELLDPAQCQTCHPDHVRDWAASMHAYATGDPIFRAMHARGQRETDGKLGTFCLNCHAPMAVRDGLVTGKEDLDSLPHAYKGVTCYFCHSVDAIAGTHNNPLVLATDLAIRGPLADAVPNTAHANVHSEFQDRDRLASAALCGTCHDVDTPAGAHLERGFQEWQASVFNQAPGGQTCAQCHMPQSADERPVAVYAGAPARRMHSHLFPAVDQALTPWPDQTMHAAEIQKQLEKSLQSAVCVQKSGTGARISVQLDAVGVGHGFPSGAALDRRVWVEVVARKGGQVVYQSGVRGDHEVVENAGDPDLWLMRDCGKNAAGDVVHMFWEVAQTVGNALPAQVTFVQTDPRFYQSHIRADYPQSGGVLPVMPDEVTMRVRMQPVAREVLEDLVKSGDLTQALADAVVTLPVGATLTWTADVVGGGVAPTAGVTTYNFVRDGLPTTCVTATNLDPRKDSVMAERLVGCVGAAK